MYYLLSMKISILFNWVKLIYFIPLVCVSFLSPFFYQDDKRSELHVFTFFKYFLSVSSPLMLIHSSGAEVSLFFFMISGIILKTVCSSLDGPLVYPVFFKSDSLSHPSTESPFFFFFYANKYPLRIVYPVTTSPLIKNKLLILHCSLGALWK